MTQHRLPRGSSSSHQYRWSLRPALGESGTMAAPEELVELTGEFRPYRPPDPPKLARFATARAAPFDPPEPVAVQHLGGEERGDGDHLVRARQLREETGGGADRDADQVFEAESEETVHAFGAGEAEFTVKVSGFCHEILRARSAGVM